MCFITPINVSHCTSKWCYTSLKLHAESYRVGKPVVAAWCYENITLWGWLFFKIRLGIYLVWPQCRQDWRLIIQQDNVSEMWQWNEMTAVFERQYSLCWFKTDFLFENRKGTNRENTHTRTHTHALFNQRGRGVIFPTRLRFRLGVGKNKKERKKDRKKERTRKFCPCWLHRARMWTVSQPFQLQTTDGLDRILAAEWLIANSRTTSTLGTVWNPSPCSWISLTFGMPTIKDGKASLKAAHYTEIQLPHNPKQWHPSYSSNVAYA